ncbi:MAG: glycosyltransferase family 39 protein [Pyrinomonadaceae bacterium]|nr:glycosyltransferase family 39 protein [Pyrinomonadaceae bacterium]
MIIISLIFFSAVGVRLLVWQSKHTEVEQVQTRVTENYKHLARLLQQNGLASFFDRSSTTSNPDLLGHPPGYSILLTLIYRLAGETNLAAQLFQMICDSLAAVVIFLIAIELLPFGVGIIAGFMAAFAPQFSWNSILLLPDTLAALPILVAIYLITRCRRRPRWSTILAGGALIGVSCWFRANALLLAPFLALLMPIIFPRGLRLKMCLALIGGACLTITPLTIRNAVVFRHFIPVSLGAGQTLLEGIADYDEMGSLGLPDTDMGLIKQEAEAHNRTDYALTLFGPDAIHRDRERLARGLSIIRAHPIWFFTVMIRRAGSMWRLERAPLISSTNASGAWTTLAALVVGGIQRLFITAIILPLVVAGLILLALRRQGSVLAILLAVPVYYFCVQSVLHTEYRYVLTIHYFLFVLAAVAIHHTVSWIRQSFSGNFDRPSDPRDHTKQHEIFLVPFRGSSWIVLTLRWINVLGGPLKLSRRPTFLPVSASSPPPLFHKCPPTPWDLLTVD